MTKYKLTYDEKVNPFDDLLTAKEIKKTDIEKRATEILMGVWFGTGEFGTKAEMNPDFGALPYDSYVIEEMPCEQNEGYTMQKFFFTVDENRRMPNGTYGGVKGRRKSALFDLQ